MADESHHESRVLSKRYKLPIQLLILVSVGPIFGDILLFRVAGFAITLVHVLFAASAIVVIASIRTINVILMIIFWGMVFLELAHGLFFGLISEPEWIKSFAQFIVYGAVFAFAAGLKLDHVNLLELGPWVRKLVTLLSGVVIVQFILLNLGIPALLPSHLRVDTYNPFAELRSGKFVPAIGAAGEPSFLAIGLLTLLALVLFLDAHRGKGERSLPALVVFLVLVAITATFSMVGILSAGALMGVYMLSSLNSKRLRYVILTLLVMMLMVVSGLTEPIQSRLSRIVSGQDTSANVRIQAPIQLLFVTSSSTELSLLGTGLGLEERGVSTYFRTYREFRLTPQITDPVKIHNIPAAIRFFQGWVGLFLYLALLSTVVYAWAGGWSAYVIMLVFLVELQFASGFYLNPSTWATLALLSVLRRAQLLRRFRSDQIQKGTVTAGLALRERSNV